jgi:hypothetical protein
MAKSTVPSRSIIFLLPYVLAATLAVVVAPLVGVVSLERAGIVRTPLVAMAGGVALSFLFSRAGSWIWKRHRGSADVVFGELMLWGWVRRLAAEKKMRSVLRELGYDSSGGAFSTFGDLSADEKRRVLRELATALEKGDPFTHGHTRRVTRYAFMVASTMNLPKETVSKIFLAASIHDVGKVDTPSEILNKPGQLTDEEFTIMKQHSARGAELVERLGDPEITAMVRHHHERIDGFGYPDRLAGDDIPLGARVIAVADTFDAIVSDRPYRSGMRHKEAIAILKNVSGTQLDDKAVRAFLDYYSGKKALAWWVSISVGAQRMVGSFGSWLQNAPTTVAQGTASLGAAVVLASAASGISPALVQPSEPQTEGSTAATVAAGPEDALVADKSADTPSTGAAKSEGTRKNPGGTKDGGHTRTAGGKRDGDPRLSGAGKAKPTTDSSGGDGTSSGGGAGSEAPTNDSNTGTDEPPSDGGSDPPDDSGTGSTPDPDDDSGGGDLPVPLPDPLPEPPLPDGSDKPCTVNLLGICVKLP